MKKTTVLIIVGLLLMPTLKSLGQELGDIPESRMSADGWKDIKFDDSGDWQTVDVTTKGVTPNTGEDMGPAIQQMIMQGSGKTIYQFPSGAYNINTTIRITKGDFQIIGEGSSTKFLLIGGENSPMLIISGSRGGSTTLQTAIQRGDDQITVTSASGYEVGDFIMVRQTNGERTFDIDCQIVKILAINGNTMSVDMKIGLPFSVEKASVLKCNMLENVKLSHFYIERLTKPAAREGKISLALLYNAEVSHVESNKVLAQHFNVRDSRDLLFFQNNIYGNFGHDNTGGYQGGIIASSSTRINLINNRFHDLRHHVAFQFGVDHSVVAYNRATKYNHYSDYGQHNNKGCHNNLFEGNYGSELYDDWNKKAWGSPYAMWFRNHAIVKIGTEYLGQTHMSIIGNELEADESGLKLAAPENDNFVAANIVSIDGENGNGTMLWGDLNENATIPNSLFLTEKPDYLETWPLYGPNSVAAVNKNLNSEFLPISIGGANDADIELEKDYRLYVKAIPSQADAFITSVKLYIDDTLIREETEAPFEWGHTGSPDPDELNGLPSGVYTIRVVATDKEGGSKTASVLLIVDPINQIDGYVFAANEKETVVVSGTVHIVYGANGQYNYLYNQTEDVVCNNETFGGDPIRGVAKKCYIISAEQETPTNILQMPDSEKEGTVKIFPNPATEGFTVQVNGMVASEIAIYTATGNLVFSSIVQNNELAVNQHLRSGIYFVQIKGLKSNIITKKLIIN